MSKIKKRISSVFLSSVVMAQLASPAFAVTPDYGPAFNQNGNSPNARVQGDLSEAGVQGQDSIRKAKTTFHGTSYMDYTSQSMPDRAIQPSKSTTIDGHPMTNAQTYDVVKSGSSDKLNTAHNGFYEMPIADVPRYVKSANGNDIFVAQKVAAAYQALLAKNKPGVTTGSVNYDGVGWNFYRVNDVPYVDIPSIIWESGGTNLASDKAGAERLLDYVGGDGVNTPKWWSSFPTTVNPTIDVLAPVVLGEHVDYSIGNANIPPMSQSDYIDFSGTTWGFLRNSATITVWTDSSKPAKIWTPSVGLASIGPMKAGKWAGVDVIPGKVYIRDIQTLLKPGRNTLTLKLDDAFGRTTQKSIVIMYQPKSNLWVKNIWFAPATVKSGGKVTISAELGGIDTTSALQVFVDKDGNGRLDPSDIVAAPSNVQIAANGTRTAGYTFFAPTDKQQVLVAFKVNPNKDKPAGESDWNDNLVAKEIPIEMPWVTPPIYVNNIDYNDATPYWASVTQPSRLSRYIVDCGTVNGPLSQKYVGTDACPISFPGAAPEAWTGIRQNPSGLTITVTGSWTGSTSKMAVSGVMTRQCRGSNPMDPSPFLFNYYVPTMYRAVPNLLINKGFIPQTQTIGPALQHMNMKIYSKAVSIDRDANMSSTSISSPVPFQMCPRPSSMADV